MTTLASTSPLAPQQLTIKRPDDWHLHLRDGSGLQSVVPHSALHFARAVIMPNLQPPITTAQQVRRMQWAESHSGQFRNQKDNNERIPAQY